MNKIDLYKKNGLSEYVWGDSFEIELKEFDITNNDKIFELFDKICEQENKAKLSNLWFELSQIDAKEILENAFNRDLAYTSGINMPIEKAKILANSYFAKLNSDFKSFTNWDRNPWKSQNGAGWNPITKNTFDMAILLIDKSKVIFTYFISED